MARERVSDLQGNVLECLAYLTTFGNEVWIPIRALNQFVASNVGAFTTSSNLSSAFLASMSRTLRNMADKRLITLDYYSNSERICSVAITPKGNRHLTKFSKRQVRQIPHSIRSNSTEKLSTKIDLNVKLGA